MTPAHHHLPPHLLLMPALLLAACGGGGGGGGGGGSGGQGTASLRISVPSGTLSGTVPVTATLMGVSGAALTLQVSRDGGATFQAASPGAGCPSLTAVSGTVVVPWDADADGASGAVILQASAAGATASCTAVLAALAAPTFPAQVTIDASQATGTYAPLHRGIYDLSPVTLGYAQQPDFAPALHSVPLTRWRISVGRWEDGPPALFLPDQASISTDTAVLATASHEFYRGPNSLAGAADPANYAFGALDQALSAIAVAGAQPFLCFDYMPYTLALNQDPRTGANLLLGDPSGQMTYPNGIRTSPPATPAVYAAVVANVVRHVTGSFANGLGQTLSGIEIGNEPDLWNGSHLPYFWTGTPAQFAAMYTACATALDPVAGPNIPIGCGGFALIPGEPSPTFSAQALGAIGGARCDFVSFHHYGDAPATDLVPTLQAIAALRQHDAPTAQLVCSEWNRDLSASLPLFPLMGTALQHFQAIDYFTILGVAQAYLAPLRDPVPGSIGLFTSDWQPTASVLMLQGLESLAATPHLLAVTSQAPAGDPMILPGTDGTSLTILFAHAAPAGGSGSLSLAVEHLPSGAVVAERQVLTDATIAAGLGWMTQAVVAVSGATFHDTVRWTQDTAVRWRIGPAAALLRGVAQ